MERFTDDQFTALYRWAERERTLLRAAQRGDLDQRDFEALRDFNEAQLHSDARIVQNSDS